MSDACQGELTFLGIERSPALVQAPEGNGCANRLIRPLEENLPGLRTFDTVGQPRQAPLELRRICNSTWLIKRYAFRSPDAVRQDQLSTAALATSAATRCLSSRRRYTSLPPTSTVRLRQQVSAEGLGLAVGPVGQELEGAGAGAKRP
jgi:hypothetical protein